MYVLINKILRKFGDTICHCYVLTVAPTDIDVNTLKT